MRAFVPGSQWRVSIQILGHLRSSTREPATRALKPDGTLLGIVPERAYAEWSGSQISGLEIKENQKRRQAIKLKPDECAGESGATRRNYEQTLEDH